MDRLLQFLNEKFQIAVQKTIADYQTTREVERREQRLQRLGEALDEAYKKARRRRKYRETITQGGVTKVITNPTTKDSEYTLTPEADRPVVREGQERPGVELMKLLRKRRKKETRVILKPTIRKDMTRSGSFPPKNEEHQERFAHVKQAIRELNDIRRPEIETKAQRIRRILNSRSRTHSS